MFHRVFPMKLKNRLNEGEDAAEMIYQLGRWAKVEHWFHQPVDRDIYIYNIYACVFFYHLKLEFFNNNKTWDIHLSFTRYMIKHVYTHRFQSFLACSPRPATGLPLYRWIVYFMEIPVQKNDDLEVPHFGAPPWCSMKICQETSILKGASPLS